MHKLPAIALAGVAAAALAGTALAASRHSHVMNVALPDGSVARVEYVGDIPPKITLATAPAVGNLWATAPLRSIGGLDAVFERMNRDTEAMMRRIDQMARQPLATDRGMNVASFGSLPPGVTSYSVVSVSTGAGTCTRTTEVVPQGRGAAPKVVSKLSGDCGPKTPQGAPAQPSGPIDQI